MRTSFSGHETFPLRAGWLKKAIEKVADSPTIFSEDRAIAEFGVGRNMVRSIKYWTNLVGAIDLKEGSRSEYKVTNLGATLLDDDGWDPFMEDSGTTWFLHWQITKDVEASTLWTYLFGYYRAANIESTSMFSELRRWLAKRDGKAPSNATLKRDLQCLLNSYAPRNTSKTQEDNLQCPFSALGLVVREDGEVFLSTRHASPLPTLIFGAIIFDYWDNWTETTATLSIDQLLRDDGSPGKLLVLSEDEAFEHITQLAEQPEVPFSYQDSAGIRQLVRTGEASSMDILSRYYAHSTVPAI